MRSYDLVPVAELASFDCYDLAIYGLAWASNADFPSDNLSEALVVGGACLGYSLARIDMLGLEVIADMLVPLSLAAYAEAECMLYINVAEEIMVSPKTIIASDWIRLGDTIERLCRNLAELFGIRRLYVLRTEVPQVDEVINAAVEESRDHLSDQTISDLYNVGSIASTKRRDPARLAQYRRNVVSYLPPVIRATTGAMQSRIIVAENLHQVKAVNLARRVLEAHASERLSLGSVAVPERIDYLAHVSPPSTTGTQRMCRAAPRSAIYLMDSFEDIGSKISRMVGAPEYYWRRIWPGVLCLKLCGTADPALIQIVSSLKSMILSESGGLS